MNEYNTIDERGDGASSPAKYLQKLGEIQAFLGSGSGPLAIGLEGHFGSAPNLPYVRSSIDTLAAKKLPIWVTKVDVSNMTVERVFPIPQLDPLTKSIGMFCLTCVDVGFS